MSRSYPIAETLILLVIFVPATLSCFIAGADTGECSDLPTISVWRQDNLPFCSPRVQYPACLPKYQKLPESREFEKGRWFTHTHQKKDAWVHENANNHIRERIKLERNESLRSKGVNEFGDPVTIKKRMYKHPDCVNAFRNLFCWINFPRCNERGESMIMCRSACENYFISCGFEKDLWRCGSTEYFDGYEPEVPVMQGSDVVYMREYFPGSPWRTNKFNLENLPLKVCTPSLDGAASRVALLSSFVIVLMASVLLFLPVVML